MKNTAGIAEISPCWTTSSHHSFLVHQLSLWSAPLCWLEMQQPWAILAIQSKTHPWMFYVYALRKPYQEPRRACPLRSTVSDTDADRILAGVWQPGWTSWGLLKKGGRGTRSGSRCTGSPAAGVDICVEIISHAALMQKPFNCFQLSNTLWFPLTGPLLCFA